MHMKKVLGGLVILKTSLVKIELFSSPSSSMIQQYFFILKRRICSIRIYKKGMKMFLFGLKNHF